MKEDTVLAPHRRKVIRCSHCGGAMRDYRDGINCLLCGRALEHSCDLCKHPEYNAMATEALEKKVA